MDIEDELAGEALIELPERHALSVVTTNVALPIDGAVVGNLLAGKSVAQGAAAQEAPIQQDPLPPA
ncbi:MAG: hypothetical protein JOZ39_02570 [Chloroflexi bacterium]|nr:hypothetical protein [Chloroflexota bacterium]